MRNEAIWVITNLIFKANEERLKWLFMKRSNDLMRQLSECLLSKAIDTVLLISVLKSLIKLLDLDKLFPDEFIGSDSVYSVMESVGGFDNVQENEIICHASMDVYDLAKQILEYQRAHNNSLQFLL